MDGDKNSQGLEAVENCSGMKPYPSTSQSEMFNQTDSGEELTQGLREEEKNKDKALRETLSKRLTRARRAAGFKEADVAVAISHSGRTMISLFENGHRKPSLENIIALAELYGVTTDYLLGLTDDLALSPEEGNQALIVGLVKGVVSGHVDKFLNALCSATAVSIEGVSLDRALMHRVCGIVGELVSAFDVVIKHHGDVFNDLRGGSKLQRLISELETSLSERIRSKQLEKALSDYEHPVCSANQVERAVQIALFGQ